MAGKQKVAEEKAKTTVEETAAEESTATADGAAQKPDAPKPHTKGELREKLLAIGCKLCDAYGNPIEKNPHEKVTLALEIFTKVN